MEAKNVNLENIEPDEDIKNRDRHWTLYLVYNFIKKPGQHMLEMGKTNSGKTQFLYWLVDKFLEAAPKEALVWFDIGKSQYDPESPYKESGNEILTLLYYFSPVRIILLTGCDIEIISKYPFDVEIVHVPTADKVWEQIDNSRLNIISIDPYIENEIIYSDQIAQMFRRLIWLANRSRIYRPMTIFYDEFHNVCPSHSTVSDNRSSRQQTKINGIMKRNIQKLRSIGIRIIATSHNYTQLFKPIRQSFEWLVPRRGTTFYGSDEYVLSNFNPRWRKMASSQAYIVKPAGDHIGPLNYPLYAIPHDIGAVRYRGIYGEEPEWE
ncbi:MAG: hypothetical protein D4R45_03265 [Planctomycetaceae bacterium]|nr:MAG: hypothetical protein D4R45_03265 [Planctomycetaceae bacterium]